MISRGKGKILRLAISIVLMTVLIWKAHPKAVVGTVLAANRLYIGIAFVLLIANVVVSTVKWDVILRLRGLHVAFAYLLGSYFASIFVANFLPSRYGGDILRIYDVAKSVGDGVKATTSVLAERLSGLLVLLVMGLLGSLASYSQVRNPGILLVCGAFLASGLIFLATLGTNWWVPVLGRLGQAFRTDKVEHLSHEIRASFGIWRSRPAACVQIFVLSVMFYIGAILAMYCYGQSLDLSVPLAVYVAFIPVVYVVESVPISLNGLGVREGAIVYLFGKVGVSTTDALSLAVLVVAMRFVLSMIGGLVFGLRGWTARSTGVPGIAK